MDRIKTQRDNDVWTTSQLVGDSETRTVSTTTFPNNEIWYVESIDVYVWTQMVDDADSGGTDLYIDTDATLEVGHDLVFSAEQQNAGNLDSNEIVVQTDNVPVGRYVDGIGSNGLEIDVTLEEVRGDSWGVWDVETTMVVWARRIV